MNHTKNNPIAWRELKNIRVTRVDTYLVYRNTNIHIYIYKYMQKHNHCNDDFNNERTHFFIKIYLSHFLLKRVMLVVCERWIGDRDRLLYWPKFSRDQSSTSSSSWLWLLNRGSLMAQSPLSAAGSHFGILSPADSNRLCTWLYYFLTSTCFCCSSAYFHRCISWLTARSRVNI